MITEDRGQPETFLAKNDPIVLNNHPVILDEFL